MVTLSKELKRMMFRSLVAKSFPEISAFNRLYREARELGISYRRKEMIRDFHEVTQTEIRKDAWKFIPKKYLPPKEIIIPTTFGMKRKYHYLYELEMYNKLTGQMQKVTRTIATDTIMTLNRAESILREKVIEPIRSKYQALYEISQFKLKSVRVRQEQ